MWVQLDGWLDVKWFYRLLKSIPNGRVYLPMSDVFRLQASKASERRNFLSNCNIACQSNMLACQLITKQTKTFHFCINPKGNQVSCELKFNLSCKAILKFVLFRAEILIWHCNKYLKLCNLMGLDDFIVVVSSVYFHAFYVVFYDWAKHKAAHCFVFCTHNWRARF